MVWMDLVQQITPWMAEMGSGTGLLGDLHQSGLWHSTLEWGVLAQQFDTDVFRGTRTILNNLIKSGQLWAFLLGLAAGYIIRSATTYG
ncbi:MAG: hypothetical protein MUF72_13355 [Elainella sp. Prado103]|jgi:hypothetical protein|nr:hypothetical protein [Elainella sp. Prado103]